MKDYQDDIDELRQLYDDYKKIPRYRKSDIAYQKYVNKLNQISTNYHVDITDITCNL